MFRITIKIVHIGIKQVTNDVLGFEIWVGNEMEILVAIAFFFEFEWYSNPILTLFSSFKNTHNLPIFGKASTAASMTETAKTRVAVVDGRPDCSKDWTFGRETETLLWMARICRDVTLGNPSADRWNWRNCRRPATGCNRFSTVSQFSSFPVARLTRP